MIHNTTTIHKNAPTIFIMWGVIINYQNVGGHSISKCPPPIAPGGYEIAWVDDFDMPEH